MHHFTSTRVETEAPEQTKASPKLEPVSDEALLKHHGKHLYSLCLFWMNICLSYYSNACA